MLSTKSSIHLIFLFFVGIHSSWAASDQELEKGFVDALRYDGKGLRQERAGTAIRAYKAAGVLPYKAQRTDYTDYYVVGKPTLFMGNQLVLVMEEYQTKYVGCCVNPGAGAYVRVTGSIEPMRSFAQSNRCRLEEYADRKAFLAALPATAGMEAGKYAALLCQESDETANAQPTAPVRPALPAAPQSITPAPRPARQVQIYVNAGATVCADMLSMNKALAIARANNSYANLPDGCVVMRNSVLTRVLRESTPIPGVVVIEAGSTAAMVSRSDLSYK